MGSAKGPRWRTWGEGGPEGKAGGEHRRGEQGAAGCCREGRWRVGVLGSCWGKPATRGNGGDTRRGRAVEGLGPAKAGEWGLRWQRGEHLPQGLAACAEPGGRRPLRWVQSLGFDSLRRPTNEEGARGWGYK